VSAAPILLSGAPSKRLEKAALELAARLLCRRGCGGEQETCPDCRRTLARQHPDLLIAAPESRRRANVPSFEEGSGGKETTIPTALIRALASEASRHPYEGACRALVLLDVDRTEAQALNALLKVLEEPPRLSRFLLTASRPMKLPMTILSRVVSTSVPVLSRADTAAALRARGLSEEEAEARAAFAPGDPEDAAALDLAETRALRDAVLASLSGTLLNNSVCWALALGEALSGDEAGERLGLAAQLLRDAVAAGADPAGASVVHRERFRDLERLSAAGGARLLNASLQALELSASLGESPRNARLAAEGFALALLEEQ